MDCTILVSVSTKNKYIILKYNFINKQIKPKNIFYQNEMQYRDGLWLILPYDWPHTHAALKVLHLLYRKEITYTLQPRFCKVDLMLNALIQLKIMQYWWWFWRQWCRDILTGILTEHKLISDCRYRVIESSSLVPVLFREVFSHPYISLFHLLVNVFSVIIIIISSSSTSSCGFSRSILKRSLHHLYISYQFSCDLIFYNWL